MPGELSPRLEEGLVRLAVWMPFRVAVEQVAFFWQVAVSEASGRRHTYAAGEAYVALQTAEAERIEQDQPPVPPGPAVQLVSADGAMVPLVAGEWAEAKTLAIGTVVPVARADGTAAVRTQELTYFSRLADAETFSRLALVEFHARGTERAAVVVAPMDGSEWLQGLLDLHCPQAVRVLDFPHAVQHLGAVAQGTQASPLAWEPAQAVWGDGTQPAQQWLTEQAHALKHGPVEPLLDALRAVPVERARDPAVAAAVRDGTLRYLEKRREQLEYAAFQAQGYPIGSGCIESANKLVVEVRLKGAGMRWQRQHVTPLLALRSLVCSERWSQVWPQLQQQRRAQQQRQRRAQRQARHPTGARPTPPSLAPCPIRPVEPLPRVATRGTPKMVNGRPTAAHPWKRPLLAGGRAFAASHAKL